MTTSEIRWTPAQEVAVNDLLSEWVGALPSRGRFLPVHSRPHGREETGVAATPGELLDLVRKAYLAGGA